MQMRMRHVTSACVVATLVALRVESGVIAQAMDRSERRCERRQRIRITNLVGHLESLQIR